jgi:hypothetical protein
MKKLITMMLLLMVSIGIIHAQTGNTGLGTSTPGSKLTVNGSFAAGYTAITATTYTAGENDFYIVWNGTANGTISLPASTSGADRTGRLYFIKNTSAGFTLTIDANGTELIDNGQTLMLSPGESCTMVKTNINTASGTTYEVVVLAQTQEAYMYTISSVTAQTYVEAAPGGTVFNFTTVEFSPNGGVDFNLTTDIWTCPQSGFYRIEAEDQSTSSTANSTHVALYIQKSGLNQQGRIYFVHASLSNSGSVAKVLNIVQGETIRIIAVPCSGCAANISSANRRVEITRL